MIWLLVIPSALALSIKLFSIWLLRHLKPKELNFDLVLVAASLLVMNATELIGLISGIFYGAHDGLGVYLLLYYTGLYSFLGASLLFTYERNHQRNEVLRAIVYLFCVMLASLTVFSNLIVAGYQTMSYSVTRVPGDYYIAFQLYALSCLVIIGYSLVYSVKKSQGVERRKASTILTAFAPLLAVILGVIIAMALGYKLNMTLLISASTSILLYILIYVDSSQHLFGLLSKIPGTREWKNKRNCLSSYQTLVKKAIQNGGPGDPQLLKHAMSDIEQSIFNEVCSYHDGNQVRTAKALNVSLSTVKRKLKGWSE